MAEPLPAESPNPSWVCGFTLRAWRRLAERLRELQARPYDTLTVEERAEMKRLFDAEMTRPNHPGEWRAVFR